jgi:outer membrane protein
MAGIIAVSMICMVSVGAAFAWDFDGTSPWQMRVRGISVMPDDESTTITTIGGNAEVDSAMVPEVDITYFIKENIAVEVIAAITPHDVKAVNTAVGNLNLGSVKLLPPTATLQYHFKPEDRIRPYVGAGINYTFFLDVDSGAVNDVDYENGFGFALQAGADYTIQDNWSVNLDVKKIFLSTDVKVYALGTMVETTVDIDPLIIGAGVTYRF